jgi:hypothetical protein
MKAFLPSLTILLFATAATLAVAYEAPSELHAAVTDIPTTIDMSHADPLTWHTAPGPVEVMPSRNDGPSCITSSIGPQVCTRLIIARR